MGRDNGEIGVGILGAGGIAAVSHLPEIAAVPGLRVVNIAGRKERRLRLLQERFDVPRISTSWDELLADPEVGAVVIGLPHPLHADAAVRTLDAGKHLLMTKPLCVTMEDADRIVAASEAHPGLTVFIRPDVPPELLAMREEIIAGGIGAVSTAHAHYAHGGPELYYAEVARLFGEDPPDDLWFFDPARAGAGVLFDLGVYAVTRLCAVLGRARRVLARLATVSKPTTLDDTASLMIEFEGGVTATAVTSWCHPSARRGLHVHGSRGMLVTPGTSALLEKITPADPTVTRSAEIASAVPMGAAENQHAEWLRCIRAGAQPAVSNVWFARHVTEILLAAARSDGEDRWVEVRSDPASQGPTG